MKLRGPPQFYVDFVWAPVVAAFMSLRCDIYQVPLIMLGFLVFTFMEYWVHRVALHEFFYHGNHEYHHKNPRGYVTFPIWYTPLIFFGFYLVFPLPVFAGVVWGFVWFITWHHVLHHYDLRSWPSFVCKYAVWHLAHHHDATCNYGITVPFWDFLFGTYRNVETETRHTPGS